MKFHIHTFGCQMNVYDAERLKAALVRRGHHHTESLKDADCFILVTCSVRDKPEQKVYSEIGRLKPYLDRNPQAFVAVGGCVAQQIGEGFFKRFPRVRLVFGGDGPAGVPEAIDRLLLDQKSRLCLLDFASDYPERAPEEVLAAVDPAPAAFVSIMQGCDNFCAYCIVPYLRGRVRSRPFEAVLAEVRAHLAVGAKEITLLGQNVNAYGLDRPGEAGFAALLKAVLDLPGLERLRFTTSHPKDISDEVIGLFGEREALCPRLHLPAQSGSDRILKAMGRKYDRARYLGIIERLKAVRPNMTFSTDLMVGFPGESEADFADTLDLARTVRYGLIYGFRYSDRPGTAAERSAFKIEDAVKVERLDRLLKLQERIVWERLESQVGLTVPVLVEGAAKKGLIEKGLDFAFTGRSPHAEVVNFTAPAKQAVQVGRTVPVRITRAKKHYLVGELEDA